MAIGAAPEEEEWPDRSAVGAGKEQPAALLHDDAAADEGSGLVAGEGGAVVVGEEGQDPANLLRRLGIRVQV